MPPTATTLLIKALETQPAVESETREVSTAVIIITARFGVSTAAEAFDRMASLLSTATPYRRLWRLSKIPIDLPTRSPGVYATDRIWHHVKWVRITIS